MRILGVRKPPIFQATKQTLKQQLKGDKWAVGYMAATILATHSSKHWISKPDIRTAQLRADKCPASHFLLFNS